MTRDSAMVNVVKTHGTVRAADILHATVTFSLQLHRKTHIAHLAVEKAILSANAADTAGITMVLRLVVVVK